MQRHPTSHPQAVLFLDVQTQGCLSFEQFGSRLKVRWIISAAKLGLAIITENDRQRAKMFSGETLALIRFLILEQPVQPRLLPQPGTRGFSNRQTNQNNVALQLHQPCRDPSREQPEQPRGLSSPGLHCQGALCLQTGHPGQNKLCVLLWWDAKF